MLLLLLLRAPTRFRSVLVSRSNNSSAFQLPRAPRKLITFTATSSAARSEIFSDILLRLAGGDCQR